MKNLTPAELAAVGAVDRDRIAADLAAIVAHPSLTGSEGEVQTEMALRMTTAGLEVERVDVPAAELAADPDFPGVEVPRDVHPVVAGRLGDRESGRRAIIAGHVDVVGGGDELQWTTPPFEPRIADGLLYGRGACDMKAGVVAGLAALRALVEAEVELGGEAILLTVPGEEDGGAGMLAAIRAGFAGGVRRHHGADGPPRRDGPGRRDHVHADDPGTKRARGVPARGRLGDREAVADHAGARGERARPGPKPSRCGRCASWASPTPRRSAGSPPASGRRSVPDRLVAEGRYGVCVGQTRRRGRGRAAVGRRRRLRRRRVAARPSGRRRDHRRALRLGLGRERPPAAVGPRRDGPRRPRPAARLPRRPVRRRRPPPDRPRRRRRPSSTGPATRTWPTPRTSTSRSRTSPAAPGCSRCGSCARSAETPGPGPPVSRMKRRDQVHSFHG